MAVRTNRLAIFDAPMPTTSADLYVCPVGKTAIAKDISVMNLVGGPRDVGLSVRTPAGQRAQILWQPQMANLAVFFFTPRFVVLEPGDALELFVGVGTGTGKVRVGVWGTELAGTAP